MRGPTLVSLRRAAALLLTLAAAAAWAPARAAEHFCGRSTAHPIDQALARDSERSGGVTADLREAQSRAYAAWDKELNRLYQSLLNKAGKGRQAALRDAQRAWLAYDKAQVQWDLALHADEGTSAALNVAGAALERRRQRVCDLSTDLEGLQNDGGQR